jgi:hypothetical protein
MYRVVKRRKTKSTGGENGLNRNKKRYGRI